MRAGFGKLVTMEHRGVDKPVFVTGGTGALGRVVVAQLLAAGHEVRVASRRTVPVEPRPPYGWATADLLTGEGVAAAFSGTGVVVHCATTMRGAKEVTATRAVVEAVRRAGLSHLVYVSIVGVDRVPFGYYRAALRVPRGPPGGLPAVGRGRPDSRARRRRADPGGPAHPHPARVGNEVDMNSYLDRLPLFDGHCHGVVRSDLDRRSFELLITESDSPAPPGTTYFDSPLGLAIRRWCAPVLDLSPFPSAEEYLQRRAELGAEEANRRLLAGTGIGVFLVDTGYAPPDALTPAEIAELAGGVAHPVVRLEAVAERVAAGGPGAGEYADRVADELDRAAAGAAGLKSIVAYRHGLDFDPAPPRRAEVAAAAGRWLRAGGSRLADPVLLRHALWTGVEVARERGLPIQFHVGYGDPDIDLRRSNPLLMRDFLRAAEPVPVMLLHCYPYHREAGYLAAVYPHVHLDVGLAVHYTAASSAAVIAESLELAPFHKNLFSTDAYGLAELYYLGALLYRRGLDRVLSDWVAREECSPQDAARIARLIGADNARRVYRLTGSPATAHAGRPVDG
ncbi:MAG: amidohydrolase family protein [Streptosporangiales bacterium]|nr:amidohydrolase family protein [Streptosporangiales bacterium]